jgi:hypothetical protein
MKKYLQYVTAALCIFMMIACFLPWAYYADLDKTFNGFFSEQNKYGKPGRFIFAFAAIIFTCSVFKYNWAKNLQLFVAAVLLAYAIKSYILFASCYRAYCPDKKIGIYLVIFCSLFAFIGVVLQFIGKTPTKTNE